jgi:hypothetical protein
VRDALRRSFSFPARRPCTGLALLSVIDYATFACPFFGMAEKEKTPEQELAELVKRSRALSLEMTEVSERILKLNAMILKKRPTRASEKDTPSKK